MKNITLLFICCVLAIFVRAQVTNTTHSANSPYATIQAAIDDPLTVDGDTITVGVGRYSENILLYKRLVLRGAKAGVDGRNRVSNLPVTTETLVDPWGTAIRLQAGSSGSEIDGFALMPIYHAPEGVISNIGAPALSDISIKNNFILQRNNGNPIHMGSSVLNLTIEYNDVCGGSGFDSYTIYLSTEAFHGFWLKNNNINGKSFIGASGNAYGLYVDGNRNVGTNGTRQSIISGNRFYAFITLGMYSGWKSFENVLIAENIFEVTNHFGNGFLGGTRNCVIEKNIFTGHRHYGLWLTGGAPPNVSPIDPTLGASGTLVRNNFFSNNGSTVSSTQSAPAGDIVLGNQAPGMQASNTITENSLLSTISINDWERQGTQDPINAPCNWYGTIDPTAISAKIFRAIGAVVNYTPYLATGTDNDPINAGFQPVPESCYLPDVTAPTITCPGDVNRQCNEDSSPASTGSATATDNLTPTNLISITFTDQTDQSPDPTLSGHYNYHIFRTWRATDLANNFSECVQTILVYDPFGAQIQCPPNLTIPTEPYQCGAMVNIQIPTATSTCVPSQYITITNDYNNTNNASGFYPVGTTLVTWTARTPTRTTVCWQDITVYDWNPPVIACPDDITVNATSAAGATVNYITPVGTDNCSALTVLVTGLPSGATFPVGTTTVTYRATDPSGMQNTCSFNVTVNEPSPEITCPANIVADSEPGQCGAHVSFNATSTNSSTITYSNAPGSLFPIGTTTVTATATNSGGSASCQFNVTVNDRTTPVITCPGNVIVNCDGDTGPASTGTATATDNCTAPNQVVISHTDVSTQSASINNPAHYNYVITRTWRATDASGNFSECIQTITVHDVTAPVITCPENITVNATQGQCSAVLIIPPPSAIDNCTALQLGNGLNFDGVNDIAFAGASSIINTLEQNKRTVETYFKVSDKNKAGRQVIWEEGGVTNGLNIYIYLGRLYYGIYSKSASPAWAGTWLSTDAIHSGQWHNAVLVYDGTLTAGRLKAYLDGVLVASANASSTLGTFLDNHPAANAVGGVNAGGIFHNGTSNATFGDFFGGDIDEIRLWVSARTETELQATNTVQLQGNEPGLVLYYNFDQGIACGNNTTENTMLDRSTTQSAPLNGTLQSFALNGGCTSNWTNGSPALNSSITLTNTYTHTADASGTYPVGTTNVVWTATDVSGNQSTCTQTITVQDVTPPMITCPQDISLQATSAAGTVVHYITPVGTDDCSSATTVRTSGLASGATFPIGTTIVTHVVTDGAGLTAECSFNVIITGLAPHIVCPENIVVSNAIGECGANVDFVATETTAVPASVITYSHQPGSYFPIGTTTVTATATNPVGTATCNFTVTVNDTQHPTITCHAPIVVNNDEGQCGAVVTYAVTSTDNCEGQTIAQTAGLASGATFPIGTTTNTFVVTDASGNTAACSFTVTVNDTQHPTITCNAPIVVNNDEGQCGAVVTYAVTSTDNCAGQTIAQTSGLISGATFPIGTTTNTFVVTDASGNTATCNFTVTVNDTQDPTITCNAPIVVSNDEGQCGAVVTYDVTSTDNCPGQTITQTAGLASGATFPIGTTNNTFVVTDASGNTATCSFTVTVNDTELPAIYCPASVTLNCQDNTSSAATGEATATDNCSTVTITQSGVSTQTATGAGHYNYTITRTWRATDASGNFSECVQTITVQDVTAPVIICPANVTLNCQDNNTSTATGVATATDNCSPVTIIQSQTSTQTAGGPGHYNYVITRTWNARDITGNFSQCVQTITVRDVTNPTITCPPAVTVQCANAVPPPAPATIITADNCSPVTVTWEGDVISNQTCANRYTITRTYKATDAAGNSATCTQTIAVNDNTAPAFTRPADKVIPFTSACGYNSLPANTGNVSNVSDNCAGAVTVTYTDAISQCGYNTVITRTWKATDVCGNNATQVQTITVSDNNTSYIIYATKEVEFGEDNFINGDVGVTASNGKASFDEGDILDPYHVYAKNITVDMPAMVNNKHYVAATGGPNPPFQVHVANTLSGNHTQSGNGTVPVGNFKNLTIKKGVIASVNGSNYGKITIEEGARVTFTGSNINLEELFVGRGKNNGLTYVYFSNCAFVKVKNKVVIEEDCRVNVGGPKVNFYLGDNNNDEEKFRVKGDNTQVTLNIMIPNGKLKINGGVDYCIMTGWFIVEKLQSEGEHVTWNKYSCTPPAALFSESLPVVSEIVRTKEIPVETKQEPREVQARIFSVKVYPNPSVIDFSIVVISKSSEPITVRILDMNGKVRSVQTQFSKTNSIQVGSALPGGTYIAEVIQGNNRQTIKLVKLN